jgi:MEMO1 family protein
MLSPHDFYASPLENVPIDKASYRELQASGLFDMMAPGDDEAEHSLEMHVPFLVRAMEGRQFSLVPIVVGAVGNERLVPEGTPGVK